MNRYHAVIIALLVLMVVAVLAAANMFGIGTALAGAGGAAGAAVVGGLAMFLEWGAGGGGPTVAAVYVTLMVLGFIAGGLLMKGVHKIKDRGAATLPVYQQAPTTIPVTPVQTAPLQSAPTTPQAPVLQSAPVKEEEKKVEQAAT
jgi:hypothetical protein